MYDISKRMDRDLRKKKTEQKIQKKFKYYFRLKFIDFLYCC